LPRAVDLQRGLDPCSADIEVGSAEISEQGALRLGGEAAAGTIGGGLVLALGGVPLRVVERRLLLGAALPSAHDARLRLLHRCRMVVNALAVVLRCPVHLVVVGCLVAA
jgi:hypothetical protein